jgi:hypothetical protein
LWPFCIFYGYFVHFPPFLVCCAKKNLAALSRNGFAGEKRSLSISTRL